MTYPQLRQLPADAYLNPENFRTGYDGLPPKEYPIQQYDKAFELGQRPNAKLFISIDSVWSLTYTHETYGTTSHISSYEGIGYHSCTADLLRGFLASGCPIIVYRTNDGAEHGTRIK